MTPSIVAVGVLLALYVIFLRWYGGRGAPLTPAEVADYCARLAAITPPEMRAAAIAELQALAAKDDGREFVMMNLVRYRARAAYPAGHPNAGDPDPRAADRRYLRLILPKLLRRASLLIFVGPKRGSFIDYEGARDWHYVAMVRYRSRRDFIEFALAIEGGGITQHKWAAIEETQVFPVSALISLVFVRTMVGGVFALAALAVVLGLG